MRPICSSDLLQRFETFGPRLSSRPRRKHYTNYAQQSACSGCRTARFPWARPSTIMGEASVFCRIKWPASLTKSSILIAIARRSLERESLRATEQLAAARPHGQKHCGRLVVDQECRTAIRFEQIAFWLGDIFRACDDERPCQTSSASTSKTPMIATTTELG